MNTLFAGAGRCDITPAPGTPQGGWGAQTHERGVGADLPLYATALVLSDSVESIAIVDVDCAGFYDSDWIRGAVTSVSDLAQIPSTHIRLSYTHTHSGPNYYRPAIISEGLDMVMSWLEDLPQRIAGAVWQAQKNLRPARCAAGEGTCEMAVNRRALAPDGRIAVGKNLSGAVDHTVRIVRFDDLAEQPIATIVHYACHPTIIAWQNQFFTPDYPGVARQVVEREVGGTCLFLQGAAGNIGPIYGFTGDLRVYRRLGKWLGLEASRVATKIETAKKRERMAGIQLSGAPIVLYEYDPVESDPPKLRVRYRTMQLRMKQFPPLQELEVTLAARVGELNRLRRQGADEEELRIANALAAQADDDIQEARLDNGRGQVEWPLQGIRIGSIALLSMPGEPFIEINQRILAGSPFDHTLFSGYSNGVFGYLPHREAFDEGGYEVEGSLFSPDAADVVVEESLRMLRELAEEERRAES